MARNSLFVACCLFFASPCAADGPPVVSRPQAPGALSGKTVFLSPGHGFYHHYTLGWITQRGNNNDLVEDFLNLELCVQYLATYLESAGADVWTCRDRCLSDVEVIVDDGDPGYSETGTWRPTSSGGYGGTGRFATVGLAETGVARFIPEIPRSGLYPLSIHYIAGSNRAKAALIRVEHTGGIAEVRVNQERHGSTWRYVGTFFFLAGEAQAVEVSNKGIAGEEGEVVIADAIRIGGGLGSMPPNAGGAASGRRRSDECSVYWARYQGAPASVYDPSGSGDDSDDVTCRPLYSENERDPAEDPVYVSVHSNGGGGTGTETYMYLDGTPGGSEALRDMVHAEIVGDIRSGWDGGWVDRGTKTANFGELRLLSTMPGILTEIAFHDNASDAAAEREPRFRRIVARAIYHGVAKHFGGVGAMLLPEPPESLLARGSGSSALLSWKAPPAGSAAGGAGTPSSYRVYRSPNGFAFDGGRAAAGTSARIDGLLPGSLTFFRITAVNAGGESFPTKVATVRVPLSEDSPRVLIVDGYDRLDGDLNLRVQESSALGTVDRQILDRRMNSFDYAVEHALAFSAASLDLGLDTAGNESVEAGTVSLGEYDLVDWLLGREGVADDTLNPGERSRIQAYLSSGGSLLLSGSEIGTDLALNSSAAAKAFFNDWLKAGLAASGGGSGDAASAGPASFTSQEAFLLSDGSGGFYDARGSDLYTPLGSAASLIYGGVPGGAAGIQFAGSYRLIHLAFPLEAIALRGARDLLVERALDFLLDVANNPPQASIRTEPAGGRVRLSGGIASILLDGSASDDGDGGTQGLTFRWRKVEGPSGERIERPAGWDMARSGFGYGDGDDATVLTDMRGSYMSLFLVKDFQIEAATAVEEASLRVICDDGFAAFLNGVEVARVNLPAGAGYGVPASAAVEPQEETVDLGDRLDALREGRNLLAIEVHNSALDSSDLSIIAEMVVRTPGAVEAAVPAGSRWFLHKGRTPPEAGWNGPAFEPTPRTTRVEFTAPGLYRFELEVGDGEASSTAQVAVEVLPEAGGEPFRRGDSDSSGAVDISDAVSVLSHLFLGGAAPSCPDAADSDDSGGADITDAIRVLGWLFTGGVPPPLPGPLSCGPDPTEDGLAECEDLSCGGKSFR